MSPRPYRLGQRGAAVAQTRARVVEAARELLSAAQSPRAFTVDAVARRAGVSRMTVYYQFGSKTGLLEELFNALAEQGGMDQLAGAFHEADPSAALRRFAAVFGRFWGSNREVIRRIRALAVLDNDLDEVLRARDDRRRQGLRVILARMGAEGDVEEMVAVLHALSGFEFFDRLAGEERTPEEVVPLVQELMLAAVGRPRAS